MKYFSCLMSGSILLALPAYSQIIPDDSLSTQVLSSDRSNYIIQQGKRLGNNLFHSFESFSVPTNGSVLFDNAADVRHIFSRVTGNSISEIDGVIRTLGEADLFLLNPNGIIFGSGAVLDLGGSFIASTGESINFADGIEFSAVSRSSEPLLTVSIPVGLQYGSNPGEIQVRGEGQQIVTNSDPLFLSPLIRTNNEANLEVNSDETLALVGGNVTLDGSSLRAEGGRIELGSVSSGIVGLEQTASGWQLDYSRVTIDRDVKLQFLSAIDVTGSSDGALQIVGRHIMLQDGSVISFQASNTESGNITDVNLTATESVEVSGTDSTSLLPSSINIENSEQNPIRLAITSANLAINRGGRIILLQRAINKGNDFNLKIAEEITVDGFSPFNIGDNSFLGISFLGIVNLGMGDGGNVNLDTNRLKINNGAFVASITISGTGNGGDVNINATESIEVSGRLPLSNSNISSLGSSISTSTLGQGDGGRILLNTARLTLKDGGNINSNALDSGNGGEIEINASEFIELIATDLQNPFSSSIDSVSINNNLIELQTRFGLPSSPSGDAGSIKIKTPKLNTMGTTGVFVITEGTGQAGDIEIEADSILLRDTSKLSASTVSRTGGNVNLQVADLLLLQDNSSILASSDNEGNGGNIEISSNSVILTDNSQINADAVEGNGGNITIDTLGFFRSSNSIIDASSRLGIDGIVQIEQLDTDSTFGLDRLSDRVIDPDKLVVLSCSIDAENSFALIGRGGFPASSEDILSGDLTWRDWRIPEMNRTEKLPNLDPLIVNSSSQSIIEAQGWKINSSGKIVLTTEIDNEEKQIESWFQSSSCPNL